MSKQTGSVEQGWEASRPTHMPLKGWRKACLRVIKNFDENALGLVSAGVAFYFLLATLPAFTAFVVFYGLLNNPADVQYQIETLSSLVPPEVSELLLQQMIEVSQTPTSTLQLSAMGSILLALWSSSRGTTAMIAALNIVYNEERKSSFLKRQISALGLTIGILLFFVVSLFLITVIPTLLAQLGLGRLAQWFFSFLRWPLLITMVLTALAIFFRYGPNRRPAQWHWVSPGALVAMGLWVTASMLFSWYVSNISDYNETYGALGALMVLLIWFYLTTGVFLLGGALNKELEHQTLCDTTIGPPKPMGERGAYVADTLAEDTGFNPEHRKEGKQDG